MRWRLRNDWRPRSYYEPEIELLEDDTYPLMARTWRQVSATQRLLRRGAPEFTFHAASNAAGTLVALAIAYLVSLAAGLVDAVPVAVIASFVAIAGGAVAVVYRLAPKQLLRARATELLDAEPGPVVDGMAKIFESPKSVLHVDLHGDREDLEWEILDAIWDLPDRERTIIAVRFGGRMTLAAIGEAMGISRERVRHVESHAIGSIREAVQVAEEERRRRDRGLGGTSPV